MDRYHFEHYLQDIAKLKQDLYFGWSTRNFDDTNLEYELNSLFIWEKIFKSFITILPRNFKIFMILCLLRIIPYSKNKNDIEWIDKSLNKEIKNLNVLITGGAGFAGSNLINGLLNIPKIKITVIDNLSYGNQKI